MSSLLYLQASPRGARSYSIAAADAFVAAYRDQHPGDEIRVVNLFDLDLPAFDGAALNAKYAILGGQAHSIDEAEAWQAVESVIRRFTSADKYVLAVPMWNFSVPYRLKQFIDVLVQPGYTFSYSPEEGYKGLVTGKPIFIAYARGGEYPAGNPAESMDLQSKYLELILGFIGFTDIRRVFVEPTLSDPAAAEATRTAGIRAAREAAGAF